MFGLMPRRRERRTEGTLARRGYTPFDLLPRRFASLFDRMFAGWPVPVLMPWEPMDSWGIEMEEGEKEVVVRAEMPGFEASELEVTLRGNVLSLRAEHREPAEKGAVERREARLERTVTLPAGIEPEKVEACYRNGVLEIHVPRTPEAQPRRIEVKA